MLCDTISPALREYLYVVRYPQRTKEKNSMKKERNGGFRLPQKELWFGLVVTLVGLSLMLLAFLIGYPF